jgi:hypothetical protein
MLFLNTKCIKKNICGDRFLDLNNRENKKIVCVDNLRIVLAEFMGMSEFGCLLLKPTISYGLNS